MPRGRRYSDAVKRAGVRLVLEDRLTFEAARERLLSDHGETVPRSTIVGWIAAAERNPAMPQDLSMETREQARRVLRLTRAELSRLERMSGQPDLTRIERVARILRSIEGRSDLKGDPNPNGKRVRTLEDLSSETEEA